VIIYDGDNIFIWYNSVWGLEYSRRRETGEKDLNGTGALKDGSASTSLTLKSRLMSKYMKAGVG
jgi:hypothetical protein